jgi:hypothetical protein
MVQQVSSLEASMANSLNIDLKDGDVVIIKASILRPEFKGRERRRFKVSGGFGMNSFTSGTALFGEFLDSGEKCRMEGYDIESLDA